MNLASNCWFPQCYNTRMLQSCHHIIFTYLLFNLRFTREQQQYLLQTIRLFISEWDGRCDWLQTAGDLSTTSFEAFELEITVHYPVHTWTETGSFMRNLTSWPVPFWLVLLTEHEVLSTAARRMRYTAAWLPDNNCTRLADSLRQTVGASKFPTLVGQFTQQPLCTTILLWQIFLIRSASSCEIFMILSNSCWYLGLDSFPR